MLHVASLKNRYFRLTTLAIGVMLLTVGCKPIGRWTGNSLSPEMARDQLKLLRPETSPGKFVSADIRLQQDGTFTADINYDGKLETHQGNYTYDEGKSIMTFMDNRGNSYVYVLKKVNDQTIQLVKGIKGTDVTLTLRKQP